MSAIINNSLVPVPNKSLEWKNNTGEVLNTFRILKPFLLKNKHGNPL